MDSPRLVLVSLVAVAACGGGTIRLADDDESSSDGPVALAPTPQTWEAEPADPTSNPTDTASTQASDSTVVTDSSVAQVTDQAAVADSVARDSIEAVSQGYAPYGADHEANAQVEGELETRRIGQWSHTGIGESRRLVIRNANQWAEFWAELGQGDRPEVDFTSNVVIAVASGQRPSGGHEIAIQRVRSSQGELIVEVVETTPGPNCMTASVLTQPVDVVVVPLTGARSWSFVELKEVRGCR
jgi:PrcB C-terminal